MADRGERIMNVPSELRTDAGNPPMHRADATVVQGLPLPQPQPASTGSSANGRVPHLVLLSGAEKGKQLWFNEGATTIGRARDNAVVIAEVAVSRHHARIERDAEGLVLRDERSGNGTRVNGRKTDSRALRDGDVVQVGATRLRFVDPGRRRPTKALWVAAALALIVCMAAGARTLAQRRHQEPEAVAAAAPATAPLEEPRHAGVARAPVAQLGAEPRHVEVAPAPVAQIGGEPRHVEVAPAPIAAGDESRHADAAASARVHSAASAVHASAARPKSKKALPKPALAKDLAPVAPEPGGAERFEQARREGLARLAENKIPEALRAFEEARREKPTAELAKIIASLHVRIGTSLSSSEAGLPAAAAEFHAALDDEPQNPQALRALQQIEAQCRDVYLRGYIAKEEDPAAARTAFRIVISALPPADQTAQKARHWLEKLDGKAPIDD
jgi:hypothetical protein